MEEKVIEKTTDLFIITKLFDSCKSYSEFINYYNNFTTFLIDKEIYSLRTNTKFL